MKPMTMRERMLAFMQGRPHDRVPFAVYEGMLPTAELWEFLGRENMGLIRWSSAHRTETPNCRTDVEKIEEGGRRVERRILHTPKGSLKSVHRFEPVYGSASAEERYVKDIGDYDILDAYLEDTTVIFDANTYQEQTADLGDDGLPMVSCPRTAWQQLWVEWVDIENLSWHFADHEDRVMRTVELMNGIARRVFDCVCRLKPVFAQIPDNITAPMIGPERFERFCLPMYRELSDRLAEHDIPVVCHMDGDLKPLWDLIGRSGLKGIDSLSPPPDNDTSVADATATWPEMRLMLNFPSSVHCESLGRVREVTREILSQGGHTGRLQFQLSENVPPDAWRTSLPVIAEEIAAFGTPGCYRD